MKVIHDFFREAKEVLRLAHPRLGALIYGVIALMWGLWLANPWLESFDSSPSYAALAQVLPEWAWGLVMIALGVLTLYSISQQFGRLRRWLSLIHVIFWMFVSTLLAIGNLSSAGIPVYYVIAFLALFFYVIDVE